MTVRVCGAPVGLCRIRRDAVARIHSNLDSHGIVHCRCHRRHVRVVQGLGIHTPDSARPYFCCIPLAVAAVGQHPADGSTIDTRTSGIRLHVHKIIKRTDHRRLTISATEGRDIRFRPEAEHRLDVGCCGQQVGVVRGDLAILRIDLEHTTEEVNRQIIVIHPFLRGDVLLIQC